MDYGRKSLELHYQWKGKISVVPKMELRTRDDLSLAYTPGVAEPCLAIQKDPEKSFELTGRWNTVAVITDGTAILGLGDIGPEAGMPVMEGKCVLFKAFGGIDAVPLCLRTKDPKEIIRTVSLLAGSFGGINLEDISAPRCFEVEEGLKAILDIPVFHDDQHGTAAVVLAALYNALKVTGRKIGGTRAAICGAGAAGTAVTKLLAAAGLGEIIFCDRQGAIYEGRPDLTPAKAQLAAVTNPGRKTGSLADTLAGADVFIGVSGPGLVTEEMVRSMRPDPIVLALANPVPEIEPEAARRAGARVIGTGRSDLPNQINNVLAFPGIFRGALDVRARDISGAMVRAASLALASLVPEDRLGPDYLLPGPLDPRVAPAVAAAVAQAARQAGLARL